MKKRFLFKLRNVVPFFLVFLVGLYVQVYARENTVRQSVKDIPVENLHIENGNESIAISWKINQTFSGEGKILKGFRLYRLKGGLEMEPNVSPYRPEKDLGDATQCKIKGLSNGEQYVFKLKAYDERDEEFWETLIFGFPGTDTDGRPEIPKEFYAVAGNSRVAVFWAKNLERDIIGYEIYRKGPDDQDVRLIARIPKIVRLAAKKEDTSNFFQEVFSPAYIDKKVENGKSYEYRVRAMDAEGYFSDFTEIVSAMPIPYSHPTGKEVLLLVNSWTDDGNDDGLNDSEEVARYYAERRGVPSENILRFKLGDRKVNYANDVQKSLKEYLLKTGLAGKIRYIVPCYNMPLRAGNRAFDSRLADVFDRFTWGRGLGTPNPYFQSGRHFDGTYGIYLVVRVDGPTVEIAKGLIDKAIYAERNVTARSGLACFGTRVKGGSEGDRAIREAAHIGQKMGIRVVLKDPGTFDEHELKDDTYWYFAWYHGYRDPIEGMWPPGAVGAHLISSSFYGIRSKQGVQSWVQGLLEKGITGTFGAVVEPYLQGYTKADVFFSHFWPGEYNFAESFYMATPTVQWAMSAVGDPLFRLKK